MVLQKNTLFSGTVKANLRWGRENATDQEIGIIDRVLTYPAHKIYQVRGQREYLIPAVPGVFIESTDPDAGEMRVHMMKGLATDED